MIPAPVAMIFIAALLLLLAAIFLDWLGNRAR
jgi:hypothetical protein